jgi:hypothetical protein
VKKAKTNAIDLSDVARALEGVNEKLAETEISKHARKNLKIQAEALLEQLGSLLQKMDNVRRPDVVFDPSNPHVMGAVTALALVSQPRVPLSELADHYGSGIYAIYYNGPFDLYAPVSCSETPIYVGQAAPEIAGARTPYEQGTRLSRRLKDHKRSIRGAHNTLATEDFEVRSLVVQSKWEGPAESYLINLFRPIWNKEVKLVFGIGKHGDAPDTRTNSRSPWDVIHDSRAWAKTDTSRSREDIYDAVRKHFDTNPPMGTAEDVFQHFMDSLRQFS